MPPMSELINDEFFSKFLEHGLEEMSSDMFTSMAYQGFDPLTIRNELKHRGWSKGLLLNVIVFFLVRGTNIGTKAVARSTESCKAMLREASEKGLTQRPVTPNSLTIGRIVASVPEMVASILKKYGNNCRVLSSDVGDCKRYLKFSAGASLCVNEAELEQWIIWAKAQDAIINPKSPNPDRVVQFAHIQYSSALLSVDKRRAVRRGIDAL